MSLVSDQIEKLKKQRAGLHGQYDCDLIARLNHTIEAALEARIAELEAATKDKVDCYRHVAITDHVNLAPDGRDGWHRLGLAFNDGKSRVVWGLR